MKKKCSKCKKEKLIDDFPKNKSRKDGLHQYCKTCNAELCYKNYPKRKDYFLVSKKVLQKRNHKYVLDFLKINPCVDCGESDPIVLEFDHLGEKHESISNMVRRCFSLETIEKEIKKCVVRCANCHRRKTSKNGTWYRSNA